MNHTATEWTLDGFVEHFAFVHHKMLDHKFCWLLGAGASFASGIPLGSELVDRWLREMHVREDGGKTALEKWATEEKLEIDGFKFGDRASFYPKIYQRCFHDYPEEGYAYLESVMSGQDPSPGYSILAQALAQDPPRHNVVITTNFDNLVADALSVYTDTFPFVCGHESLTAFVRVAMRRPLICKIHRDLLLGPQNDPRSLRRLHDAWGTALRALFQHYTPIFIGYGGNDDTLMDLLESLQPADIKGQMIWCYYESGRPSDRIVNVVSDLNGVLVPIPDFDLLMVLLGEKMGINLLDEEIERRAKERTQRYRDRIQLLDTVKHPFLTKALAAIFERSGGWWAWYRKAERETDLERRETVYRQGIQLCPKSGDLHVGFAMFLWEVRKNPSEAERFFQKGLSLQPEAIYAIANYAEFLLVNERFEEASDMIERAKSLSNGKQTEVSAVLAWHEALLACLTAQKIMPAINALMAFFSEGLPRTTWRSDDVLGFAKNRLSSKDYTFLSALAAGLLDAGKVPEAQALIQRRLAAVARVPDNKRGTRKPNSRPASGAIGRKKPRAKKVAKDGSAVSRVVRNSRQKKSGRN